MDPESTQDREKVVSKLILYQIVVPFWLHFGGSGSSLGSIWEVFGLILAPFLLHVWSQIALGQLICTKSVDVHEKL